MLRTFMGKNMSEVCLDRCREYQYSSLRSSLARVLSPLLLSVTPGMKVVLKPNLISSRAPSLACTHPLLVAVVASWFCERGCRVAVGDSPAFGSALQVMQCRGFVDVLKDMNVEFIEFATLVTRTLSNGVRVSVAAEALECDLLVNMPKIKAHDQMYVTMAVKNIFGIVIGPRKSWMHMRYGGPDTNFAEIILALHDLLPDTVVVADGIEAMHRHGPVWGDSLFLGCLAASRSAVSLDCALLAALELDWRRSPLAVVARQQSVKGASMEDIVFPLMAPDDFYGSGFVAPDVLSPVRFNPWRYVKNSLKRVVLGLHHS